MAYDYDRREAARPIPVDKPGLAKLAKQLVEQLPRHLKFRPDDMDGPLSRARGFTHNWGFSLGIYETTDVQGRQVAVSVDVGWANMENWSPTRQWIAGGNVKSEHRGRRGLGVKVSMNIKVNASRTPNEILSRLNLVEREAYSVLIHETTHLRDLLQGVSEYHDDHDNVSLYYNSKIELRAFMQQIADEALEEVEKLAKISGIGTWGITLSTRLVERALEMSSTWERIRKHLKPENERLILRGVERAIRDEWPRLEKQYPEETFDDV